MSNAWHYVGALAVVVVGVWIAQAISNPIARVVSPSPNNQQ